CREAPLLLAWAAPWDVVIDDDASKNGTHAEVSVPLKLSIDEPARAAAVSSAEPVGSAPQATTNVPSPRVARMATAVWFRPSFICTSAVNYGVLGSAGRNF